MQTILPVPDRYLLGRDAIWPMTEPLLGTESCRLPPIDALSKELSA